MGLDSVAPVRLFRRCQFSLPRKLDRLRMTCQKAVDGFAGKQFISALEFIINRANASEIFDSALGFLDESREAWVASRRRRAAAVILVMVGLVFALWIQELRKDAAGRAEQVQIAGGVLRQKFCQV